MKKEIILLPKTKSILRQLGLNLKMARLRRRLSSVQIALRANISRPTLIMIEKGAPNVSIGYYLQVLSVLGLEKDMLKVANDDILGRKLQDADLNIRKRSPKNNK